MRENFLGRVAGLFGRKPGSAGETEKPEAARLLPFDVRYALRYKKAVLNSVELTQLLKAGFIDETLYLATKILDSQPEKQQKLLEDLVNEFLKNPQDRTQIIKTLELALQQTDQNKTVQAGKLAQLSRQGFDSWNALYERKSEQFIEEAGDRTPVLVAYATLRGLRHFIGALQKHNKGIMYIMIPERLNDINSRDWGYRIVLDHPEKKVHSLSKELDRSTNLVLIDDVKRTGVQLDKLLRFWQDPITRGEVPSSQNMQVPEVKVLFASAVPTE